MASKQLWRNRDLSQHLDAIKLKLEDNKESIFINLFIQSSSIVDGPLSKTVVSIKATFDVKGQKTSGGSRILGDVPAVQDADAVARLRAAGASFIGHTNMTELAYSGVGLNPHYGTPDNPVAAGCIPGGSTSGGAVTVAKSLADIALGTDTGGSLRIPAAFCGLTGFKPSQASVSRHGCLPLSYALDSVGVMAKNVEACELAWRVLANQLETAQTNQALEIIVPENFGIDQLDARVALGFSAALNCLRAQGVSVQQASLPIFEDYKAIPVWQFSALESRRYYQTRFALDDKRLDPRVKQRIKRGESVSDEEFAVTCGQRDDLIRQTLVEYPNRVFLMPTVACLPPTFEELQLDEDYDRINLLCLRNTTFANVIDGCSISLPFSYGRYSIGIMLTAVNGQDHNLLCLAKKLECIFSTS